MRIMKPAELRKIGKALWGDAWQAEMAEAFDVDGSTIRRWANGSVRIPGTAVAALNALTALAKTHR
jgi:hypothetical protein